MQHQLSFEFKKIFKNLEINLLYDHQKYILQVTIMFDNKNFYSSISNDTIFQIANSLIQLQQFQEMRNRNTKLLINIDEQFIFSKQYRCGNAYYQINKKGIIQYKLNEYERRVKLQLYQKNSQIDTLFKLKEYIQSSSLKYVSSRSQISKKQLYDFITKIRQHAHNNFLLKMVRERINQQSHQKNQYVLQYVIDILKNSRYYRLNKNSYWLRFISKISTNGRIIEEQQSKKAFQQNFIRELQKQQLSQQFLFEFSSPNMFIKIFIYMYSGQGLYKQLNKQMRNGEFPFIQQMMRILILGIRNILQVQKSQTIIQKLYRGINIKTRISKNQIEVCWKQFNSCSKALKRSKKFSDKNGELYCIQLIDKYKTSKGISYCDWFIDLEWPQIKDFVCCSDNQGNSLQRQLLILPGFCFRVVEQSQKQSIRFLKIKQVQD